MCLREHGAGDPAFHNPDYDDRVEMGVVEEWKAEYEALPPPQRKKGREGPQSGFQGVVPQLRFRFPEQPRGPPTAPPRRGGGRGL